MSSKVLMLGSAVAKTSGDRQKGSSQKMNLLLRSSLGTSWQETSSAEPDSQAVIMAAKSMESMLKS